MLQTTIVFSHGAVPVHAATFTQPNVTELTRKKWQKYCVIDEWVHPASKPQATCSSKEETPTHIGSTNDLIGSDECRNSSSNKRYHRSSKRGRRSAALLSNIPDSSAENENSLDEIKEGEDLNAGRTSNRSFLKQQDVNSKREETLGASIKLQYDEISVFSGGTIVTSTTFDRMSVFSDGTAFTRSTIESLFRDVEKEVLMCFLELGGFCQYVWALLKTEDQKTSKISWSIG